MRPRLYYNFPNGAETLKGLSFDWVHVYPGAPVPPTGGGSFNYLLWELLQQHYPDHLLISSYYPESLDLAWGKEGATIYVRYKQRVKMLDRVRKLLGSATPNLIREFIDEACQCIASTNASKIMVWGNTLPLPYLRRAFPDKTITFAQRYFEVARASPRNYEYCDYLLTQSEGTTCSLFEQEFAIQPTVVSIPNGVNLEQYRPISEVEKRALRERLGLPQDKIIALFPSKLNRNKGTSYLFNWVRQCHQSLHEVYFVVAGAPDSRMHGDTLSLVELLRRTDNARWLQGVTHEEMPQWYQASDFSLMPGVWREGMSMAAIESLATGLPVIATGRGIYSEIVFHQYNGWICRPEVLFREGLEAIRALSSQPELRKRLSLNARAYAERRLSRQRCLENFRAFFEGRLLDIDDDLSPVAGVGEGPS